MDVQLQSFMLKKLSKAPSRRANLLTMCASHEFYGGRGNFLHVKRQACRAIKRGTKLDLLTFTNRIVRMPMNFLRSPWRVRAARNYQRRLKKKKIVKPAAKARAKTAAKAATRKAKAKVQKK